LYNKFMNKNYVEIIRKALAEDAASKDVSTRSVVPAASIIRAELVAKQDGVLCGLDIVRDVFCTMDGRCRLMPFAKDGDKVKAGQIFAQVRGPAREILAAERTALNFIQHLSGIATLTSLYVEKTKGTAAKIYDTRKTVPGMRDLAKYAVRCGGGKNHRMNLEEMVMFKDNHLKIARDIPASIAALRKQKPARKIEVECESMDELAAALEYRPDIILLDNMDLPLLRRAITAIKKWSQTNKTRRPEIEISGGVKLDMVRSYAATGVDRISAGAITHSAPALDISLEIVSMQ